MMTFRCGLRDFKLPLSTVWLMNDIAEAKGRQELYTKQSAQILKALREMAMVESVESSNRIEGVTVAPDRLRLWCWAIRGRRTAPRKKSRGTATPCSAFMPGPPTCPSRRTLYATCTARLRKAPAMRANGRQWTTTSSSSDPAKHPGFAFTHWPLCRCPTAVEEMCLLYRHALDQEHVPALVAVACLVLDFLCIHPFRDGNGRVLRLLTVLGLYHHGFEVGRYISVERLIEESKEDYYAVLQASSTDWHNGKHDQLPWLNYFLAIVRRVYVQFEERAGQVKSPRGAKTALIEAAVISFVGEFGLSDIERACPGVSRDMVRRILQEMQRNGSIECLSKGRSAKWRKRVITQK